MKPDRNIECPPFEITTEGYYNFNCSLLGHDYFWRLSEKRQYRQQLCKRCKMTGKTEKWNLP